MKRYAFLLLAACLFATVSVSYAQDNPNGKSKAATENQPTSAIIAHVDDIDVVNIKTDFISSNPECQDMAFAEATQAIRNFRTTDCEADAEYGSCSNRFLFYNYNLNKPQFAFRSSPINHSSGGLPLVRSC